MYTEGAQDKENFQKHKQYLIHANCLECNAWHGTQLMELLSWFMLTRSFLSPAPLLLEYPYIFL